MVIMRALLLSQRGQEVIAQPRPQVGETPSSGVFFRAIDINGNVGDEFVIPLWIGP